MKTKQILFEKEENAGWYKGAKERFADVRKYIYSTFGGEEYHYMLRFELMCQYAESIAPDYHVLIANEHFRDGFHFQWLKHDFHLAEHRITGDYELLKKELITGSQFSQFIFSHININKAL